jgi:hypothetical protein
VRNSRLGNEFTPISWVQSTKQRLVEWQEVAGVK